MTPKSPISPISPKSTLQATLTQVLCQHPTLSLTQILIWVEEAFTQWHDRNLGPETYDPQEGLDLEANPPKLGANPPELVFHQDCPGPWPDPNRSPDPNPTPTKKGRSGDCPPTGP